MVAKSMYQKSRQKDLLPGIIDEIGTIFYRKGSRGAKNLSPQCSHGWYRGGTGPAAFRFPLYVLTTRLPPIVGATHSSFVWI